MAEAKAKTTPLLKGATPKGILTWAWLEKPDTKFGKSQYKAALRLEKGIPENDAFVKKINDLHKSVKGKTDQRPFKDGDVLAEDNEKRENLRGFWVMTFKSKNKPEQMDAKRNELKVSARSGDLAKISFSLVGMDTGTFKGATAYLNKIMLLERRANDDDGFGEGDEDYEADTAAPRTNDRTDDESEDEGEDSGDGGHKDF